MPKFHLNYKENWQQLKNLLFIKQNCFVNIVHNFFFIRYSKKVFSYLYFGKATAMVHKGPQRLPSHMHNRHFPELLGPLFIHRHAYFCSLLRDTFISNDSTFLSPWVLLFILDDSWNFRTSRGTTPWTKPTQIEKLGKNQIFFSVVFWHFSHFYRKIQIKRELDARRVTFRKKLGGRGTQLRLSENLCAHSVGTFPESSSSLVYLTVTLFEISYWKSRTWNL